VAGLSLRTEAARRLVDSDPQAAAATLGAVRSDADELVADIRRLAYDLRPPALDELGLAEALRLHARSFNGVRIAVHDDGVEQLPAAVEAAAYRIAAEAMINVSRHAATPPRRSATCTCPSWMARLRLPSWTTGKACRQTSVPVSAYLRCVSGQRS
jgi:signal transduction histidine kinase